MPSAFDTQKGPKGSALSRQCCIEDRSIAALLRLGRRNFGWIVRTRERNHSSYKYAISSATMLAMSFGVIALAAARGASAENAAVAPASDQPASSSNQVEEIVVTDEFMVQASLRAGLSLYRRPYSNVD